MKFSYFIDKTTNIVGKFGAIFLLLLIFIVTIDVFMRYFLNYSSAIFTELEWHLFSLIFLFGLSYTLKHDKHVRVDIFYANYSKKRKAIFNIISNAFFIAPFAMLVLIYSLDFAILSLNQNEVSADFGGLCCRYIIKLSISFGFFMLFLQSISEIIKNYLTIKTKVF